MVVVVVLVVVGSAAEEEERRETSTTFAALAAEAKSGGIIAFPLGLASGQRQQTRWPCGGCGASGRQGGGVSFHMFLQLAI